MAWPPLAPTMGARSLPRCIPALSGLWQKCSQPNKGSPYKATGTNVTETLCSIPKQDDWIDANVALDVCREYLRSAIIIQGICWRATFPLLQRELFSSQWQIFPLCEASNGTHRQQLSQWHRHGMLWITRAKAINSRPVYSAQPNRITMIPLTLCQLNWRDFQIVFVYNSIAWTFYNWS